VGAVPFCMVGAVTASFVQDARQGQVFSVEQCRPALGPVPSPAPSPVPSSAPGTFPSPHPSTPTPGPVPRPAPGPIPSPGPSTPTPDLVPHPAPGSLFGPSALVQSPAPGPLFGPSAPHLGPYPRPLGSAFSAPCVWPLGPLGPSAPIQSPAPSPVPAQRPAPYLARARPPILLFDHVSGAAPAPPATADGSTRSQWLSRDTTARLAIRNHLPATECAHFGEHRTAQALYDAVVARYSSPATAAIGRLLLPYLFPDLSTFATVADQVTHLRTSNARYRATVPTEFLPTNQPPMFITLYFIVTHLPDSLRSVRDHIFTLDPTSLIVDLLEQHLLATETSALAVGAARGTPRSPFFEGCSPSPLSSVRILCSSL
ncbi:unnamed protein product, partial [Closterium sp. NIES-54]